MGRLGFDVLTEGSRPPLQVNDRTRHDLSVLFLLTIYDFRQVSVNLNSLLPVPGSLGNEEGPTLLVHEDGYPGPPDNKIRSFY